MRKLIVAEFISLDGVIQAPGGPDEDPSGEFRFGGWQVPYNDEAIGRAVLDLFSQPFELLLGRRTLRQMGGVLAARWGRFTQPPDRWPVQQRALEGDRANAVRALKREDGGYLLTHGSGDMVRQLLAAGLVGELRLLIFPVLLGRGKRLFGDNAQVSAFTLAHSTSTPSGVLITRHVRSGEVRTGTFEEVE